MRIAVTSRERLSLDGIVAILSASHLITVFDSTDPRECVRQARNAHAELLILDLRTVTRSDVDFILGAQAIGAFRTIGITDEQHPLPEGLTTGVARSSSGQTLLNLARDMSADIELRHPTRLKSKGPGEVAGLPLSGREAELVGLIEKRLPNKDIAETMQLKEQSVKNMVSTVLRKLKCKNRKQVALRMSATQPL